MNTKHHTFDFDDLDDLPDLPRIKNMPNRPRRGKQAQDAKRKQPAHAEPLAEQADDVRSFAFTYHASRHERGWITASLGTLYEQQWLNDVLRLLKGGKEANVYLCAANPTVPEPLLAAKVYRPRRFRNLKNDGLYREGRTHLDSDGRVIEEDGMLHAISKRSAYGLELLHASWIGHEYKTMQILHAAGVDLPVPYRAENNAILMSYIGDANRAAPTLSSVSLEPDEARPLFERALRNIELMLANQRVHADLSAYNILYWEGQITLIDFPQAIDPQENQNAYRIFERDVTRVCEYFARQGVPSEPRRLAAELWSAYGYRLTPNVHPAYLDAERAEDRALWQQEG